MVREKPLQIVLHQGVEDPHDRRHEPEDQDKRAPPPGEMADQVEDNPYDAVDRGLEHHPAHEGRDVRRRHRVRFGQPDVERDHAGLGRKPEECQEERNSGPSRREDRPAHGIEGIPLKTLEPRSEAGHDPEREKDSDGPHVSHDEIEKSGPPVLDFLVLEKHEKVGSRRHHLPGDKEEQCVIGQDHQEHSREKKGVKDHEACYGSKAEKPLDVPDRVDGCERGEQPDDHEEIPGQEVESQVKRQVGQAEGEHDLGYNAACHGPYTGGRGENRSNGSKEKTRLDEKALAEAQKRRQREREQEHCERCGYETERRKKHVPASLVIVVNLKPISS